MVSVIVPAYNAEKTIERCLSSLLNQTLADIEIIVVNDGSQDHTEGIINKLNSDRIRLINQENCGQGIARNTGIKHANGDYIGFVDADDMIDVNMYKSMYDAAIKYDADMVQCGFLDIRNNVSHTRAIDISGLVIIESKEEYAVNYFRGLKHTNEVCNKLIKKSFLIDNDLWFDDTRLVFSEDLLLNIKMLSYLERVYYIDKPYYFYNISDGGHCLGGSGERLEKICTLFRIGTDYSIDTIKPAIRCVACNVILEYCADDSGSPKALNDQFVKECINTSMKYKSSLKHSLIMLVIRVLPIKMKMKLIKRIIQHRRKISC